MIENSKENIVVYSWVKRLEEEERKGPLFPIDGAVRRQYSRPITPKRRRNKFNTAYITYTRDGTSGISCLYREDFNGPCFGFCLWLVVKESENKKQTKRERVKLFTIKTFHTRGGDRWQRDRLYSLSALARFGSIRSLLHCDYCNKSTQRYDSHLTMTGDVEHGIE
jgi:hypothetical protein